MVKRLRYIAVIAGIAMVLLIAMVAPTTAVSQDRVAVGPILIIGDSVLVQSAAALERTTGTVSVIADGGSGSAPCDWVAGYTDPFTGRFLKFTSAFNASHPSVVVLAFTGNPGLDWSTTGCVDSDGQYSLASLLANYQISLTTMATYASDHGAQVYFSAAPPRNPATAAGAYTGANGESEFGFNGVPQINALYQEMVASRLGRRLHWVYDPDAAEDVSNAQLEWQLTEPCTASDGSSCVDGRVQVRAGGDDAIHLDPNGAGATRYAAGLLEMPLKDMGLAMATST